ASKQSHKCCSKGCYALKKVSERPFATDRVAEKKCEEIDGFVATEASAHQTHLLCKGFEQVLRCEMLSEDDDFGEPGRDRVTVNWRGLNLNTLVGYHTERPPESMVCFSLIRGLSSSVDKEVTQARCTSR